MTHFRDRDLRLYSFRDRDLRLVFETDTYNVSRRSLAITKSYGSPGIQIFLRECGKVEK